MVEGIVGVAVRVLFLAWQGTTALAILGLVAAPSVITGAFGSVAAVRRGREISGEKPLASTGILSGLPGVALVSRPVGSLSLVRLLGIGETTLAV